MEKNMNHPNVFSELTASERLSYHGGTFAYDLGRFLRFMAIYCTEGYGQAVGDAVANHLMNQ